MGNIDGQLQNAFPFYDSIDKQNFRKKWMYDDLCTVPLLTSENRFLPFQIVRSSRYNTLQNINLYCYDGTFICDMLPHIPVTDYKITSAIGKDYITYFGNKDLANFLDAGYYYLEIYDGVETWYSEIFCVKCFSYAITKKLTVGPKHLMVGYTGITAEVIVLNHPIN